MPAPTLIGMNVNTEATAAPATTSQIHRIILSQDALGIRPANGPGSPMK